MSNRPTGITILALIYGLRGLVALAIAAVGGIVLGAVTGATILGMAIGTLFGLLALIQFIIAGALLMGKSWGRTVVIILSIISLIVGLATVATGLGAALALGIIIDLVIIWYMFRPKVKAYFRG